MRIHPMLRARRFVVPSGLGIIAALFLLSAVPLRSGQNAASPKSREPLPSPSTVNEQAALLPPLEEKTNSKKFNLEKTRADAAELSALADQLSNELKKMNVNVFSLDVVEKTEKLEKLARKIKGEANAH